VVRATHHLVNLTRERRPTPAASFSPTEDDRRQMRDRLRTWYRQQRAEERKAEDEHEAGQQGEDDEEGRALDVPAYRVEYEGDRAAAAGWQSGQPVHFVRNEQTTLFCRMLGIPDLHSDAHEGKGSDRWQAAAALHRQQQQQPPPPASSPPHAQHRSRWDQAPPPVQAAAAVRGSNPDEIDIDSESES
jgi:hypothetical protein